MPLPGACTRRVRASTRGRRPAHLPHDAPGSGKTLLRLRSADAEADPSWRSPTSAIQAHWAAQWSSSFAPALVQGTMDGRQAVSLGRPGEGVLALTYQSIAVLDHDTDGEPADPAPDDDADPQDATARARTRHRIARGGDPEAVLRLLHANGRAILAGLAGLGPITLVLDECHHLLRLWGHVLQAVIERLHPDPVVLGLTATPPADLGAREATL